MQLSLYQRLAITITFAFFIVAYGVFWWSANISESAKFQAEQKLHIALAEHLANDNPLLQDGVYDKPALENLFHTLMLLGPAFEFYFVDASGKILTYSADKDKIKRKSINLSPVNKLINNPHNLPIFGDDPRSLERQKIFSVAPVMNKDQLQGYLYVIIGGEIYDSVFESVKQDQVLWQNLSWAIAALGLLLILLLALFRFFTSPIRALMKEMTQLQAASFDKTKVSLSTWNNKSNSEIDKLGTSFIAMVEQINKQFSQLKNNDRIRRELLAHLSHDLRTPLSAMKGYIETLAINNEQLSTQERKKYIETVSRNAEQLKLLIDQIFELAHLEDGQVSVNFEPFPIGELLHDISAKFSLKAREKKITLSVTPQHCNYLVYSDIAKLERILTNLIENALRHTPEYGEITIKVNTEEDKVSIAVVDTGSGIDKDELAYIFDARYRASNAQGKKGKHAGLGLAISKRLSQLLNSELSVQSILGQGCKFSLELQAVNELR